MPSLHRWSWLAHSRWIVVLGILGALLPLDAAAQGAALLVTLRDTSGAGVAGIAVVVRSEQGAELARQTTDAAGHATFGELPAVVLIAVVGQPRRGLPLSQLGMDAAGVRMDLRQGAPPHVLDLRVEPDGLVLPDPATMLARDGGGPTVDAAPFLPTAAIATPIPLATVLANTVPPTARPVASDEASVVVGSPGATPAPSGPRWVVALTLLLVVLGMGVLLVLQRRNS